MLVEGITEKFEEAAYVSVKGYRSGQGLDYKGPVRQCARSQVLLRRLGTEVCI